MEERYRKTKVRSLIINISSITALNPIPFYGAYCATKAFNEWFSKGLYFEKKKFGVDVLCVNPLGVDTKVLHTGKPPAGTISPDACAKGIL